MNEITMSTDDMTETDIPDRAYPEDTEQNRARRRRRIPMKLIRGGPH